MDWVKEIRMSTWCLMPAWALVIRNFKFQHWLTNLSGSVRSSRQAQKLMRPFRRLWIKRSWRSKTYSQLLDQWIPLLEQKLREIAKRSGRTRTSVCSSSMKISIRGVGPSKDVRWELPEYRLSSARSIPPILTSTTPCNHSLAQRNRLNSRTRRWVCPGCSWMLETRIRAWVSQGWDLTNSIRSGWDMAPLVCKVINSSRKAHRKTKAPYSSPDCQSHTSIKTSINTWDLNHKT